MENATGLICPRGSSAYTWQAGDTPASVALRFGTTEQAIRLLNEFTVFDQLLPGDEICIPPRPLTCISGELYTVKRGDTFSGIAQAYGISTLELSERNPYVDPNELAVGQTLCVPRRESTPSTPSVPSTPSTPSTPSVPSTPNDCPTGYTPGSVQYGQTYADILLRYNISYQAFRLTNPSLTPDRLVPGQRYCIPPTGSRGLCSTGGRSYIMTQGETLASVAERFGVTVGRLLRLNPNLAPGDFIAGRVICVATQ